VAVFTGLVSTDNRGGFTSVRSRNYAPALSAGAYEGLALRVRGDGQRYKCIIRSDANWDGIAHCRWGPGGGWWLSVCGGGGACAAQPGWHVAGMNHDVLAGLLLQMCEAATCSGAVSCMLLVTIRAGMLASLQPLPSITLLSSWPRLRHHHHRSFDTVKDQWQTIRLPFSEFAPVFRAKTLKDGPPLDPSSIASVQLMLSKFEYDGQLNPSFTPGPFELPIENISTYLRQPACPR
jgi:hypothetical protein